MSSDHNLRKSTDLKLPLGVDQQFWDSSMHTKTPVSPSVAFKSLNLTDDEGSQPGSSRMKPSETQICFGMDISAMQVSSSVLSDPNGNRCAEDSSGFSSTATSEHLHPTHRAQHPFSKRHDDEISIEIGDPICVEYSAHDYWTYGTNLRTSQTGIFPSICAFEIDLFEDLGFASPVDHQPHHILERDTFYLTFLGCVEVAHHKGNDVLIQAINKVLNTYTNKDETIVPKSMILEISFHGIHMIQKSKQQLFRGCNFDLFFSLQNISFCGAHPKQLRYFGFISKHPLLPRFACHVFMSNESTQPIVESIGRAFKRSYDEYMAFAHPTEDLYCE